jgi:hypothetical protein
MITIAHFISLFALESNAHWFACECGNYQDPELSRLEILR